MCIRNLLIAAEEQDLPGGSTDRGSPKQCRWQPRLITAAHFAHSLANTSKDLYPALPGATHSPPWLDHHLRELQEKAMAERPTYSAVEKRAVYSQKAVLLSTPVSKWWTAMNCTCRCTLLSTRAVWIVIRTWAAALTNVLLSACAIITPPPAGNRPRACRWTWITTVA